MQKPGEYSDWEKDKGSIGIFVNSNVQNDQVYNNTRVNARRPVDADFNEEAKDFENQEEIEMDHDRKWMKMNTSFGTVVSCAVTTLARCHRQYERDSTTECNVDSD